MTGWSGWAALGGQLGGGSPVVGRNADGRLEAFATSAGAAGPELLHLWQTSAGGDWSDWANLVAQPSASLTQGIAVQRNRDDGLEVFAAATDGAIWHIWRDPASTTGWSDWASLGSAMGTALAVPAVERNGDGRLEVFA